MQLYVSREGRKGGWFQTDGCDEVDDDEGVEHWDDRRADGCDDVAKALEPPKEAEDSESSKHLRHKIRKVGKVGMWYEEDAQQCNQHLCKAS